MTCSSDLIFAMRQAYKAKLSAQPEARLADKRIGSFCIVDNDEFMDPVLVKLRQAKLAPRLLAAQGVGAKSQRACQIVGRESFLLIFHTPATPTQSEPPLSALTTPFGRFPYLLRHSATPPLALTMFRLDSHCKANGS